MALIYPSEQISSRWRGALQTRLRRAPLERFLRAQGLAPVVIGPSPVSDDLVRATVLIVEAGALQYGHSHGRPYRPGTEAAVGHIACVVSGALAAQISEPGAWRVAALVSAAQLLRAGIGLSAAAVAAASSVRCFERALSSPTPALDTQIRESVSLILSHNSMAADAQTAALIALSLRMADVEDSPRAICAESSARC